MKNETQKCSGKIKKETETERERERDGDRERERERDGDRERESERERDRERQRENLCYILALECFHLWCKGLYNINIRIFENIFEKI